MESFNETRRVFSFKETQHKNKSTDGHQSKSIFNRHSHRHSKCLPQKTPSLIKGSSNQLRGACLTLGHTFMMSLTSLH